jgi:gliding motility-associated-like protein
MPKFLISIQNIFGMRLNISCKSYRINWLTSILFVISIPLENLFSQCSNNPPASLDCENAPILCSLDELDGYCFRMFFNGAPNYPDPYCDTPNMFQFLRPNWIAFYAECSSLDFRLTASNCDAYMSYRMAIYRYDGLCTDSREIPEDYVYCLGPACYTSHQNPSYQLEINLVDLIVGDIYYIMIGGCGEFCDITIEVLSPPCGGGAIGDWPGDIEGDLISCTGSSSVYTVEKPLAGHLLRWYLDGVMIQEGGADTLVIDWTAAGTYELCAGAYNYCIEESADPGLNCIEIVIEDLQVEHPPDGIICHDETYLFEGDNYIPGVYDIQFFNPIGCDSTVTLNVIGVDPVEEDLGAFYLCEGMSVFIHQQEWTSVDEGSHSLHTQQSLPPFCDSTIHFSIGVLSVTAEIIEPYPLDCETVEIELDGSGSTTSAPPGSTILYQWEASEGGNLGDPSDQPIMLVNTPGRYCLQVSIIAPDGSTTCIDAECITLELNDDLPAAPIIEGPTIGCPDQWLSFELNNPGNIPITGYSWVYPSGLSIQLPNDSTLQYRLDEPDTVTICVFTTNACGDSEITCIEVVTAPSHSSNTQSYTCDSAEAGVFADTLSNQSGCDSILVRTITLAPTQVDSISGFTCDPAQAGVFTDSLSNQHGCDSITVRSISLHPSQIDTLSGQTCDPSQAGTFTDSLNNEFGCDSIIVRQIILSPSYTDTLNNNTCDPAQAGTFIDSLVNQFGCDSILVNEVTLLPSQSQNLQMYTCDPLMAGLDTLRLLNQHGCDSIIHIERIYSEHYQEERMVYLCGEGTDYRDTAVVSTGPCDSLFISAYTYKTPDTTAIFASTCDPSQVGVDIQVLQNIYSCDSTIILTTDLLPSDNTWVDEMTCQQSEAIQDTLFLSNQAGCDSLVFRTIAYVGIDTQYVQVFTCDSSQIGTQVDIITGIYCDTIRVTQKDWASFSTGHETIHSCDESGPARDTLYLTGQSGCDSLHIRIYNYTNLQANVIISNEICSGQHNGSIRLEQISGGLPPYQYRLNGGVWQLDPLFPGLSPGMYLVEYRDARGCVKSISSVNVQAGITIQVDAGPDILVQSGELIDLRVQVSQVIAQIQWTATDPIDCITCPEARLGPITIDQIVAVEVFTLDGCTGNDQFRIRLEPKESIKEVIYIPNSFTPNGDGINDLFSIFGNEFAGSVRSMNIFDRWGNALYTQFDFAINDPSQGWNGSFRGQPMDPGVYIYVVEVVMSDGDLRQFHGEVTLLK